MGQIDASMLLQSLRGNQAMVLLAYLLLRRAMTIDDLVGVTGLSADTVRSAVKQLGAKGLLHVQRGERGRQTWLPVSDTLFGRVFGQIPKISETGLVQIPKFSDSGSSSSRKKISLPLEEEEEEIGSESEKIRNCLRVCAELGIGEPKRSSLSRLPHVTPEMIRAHVEQALAEGRTLGTAIYRIENNWALPQRMGDSAGWWDDDLRAHAVVDDDRLRPLTLDEVAKTKGLWLGTCDVCGSVGDVVAVRGGMLCIDHYNAWRARELGLDDGV